MLGALGWAVLRLGWRRWLPSTLAFLAGLWAVLGLQLAHLATFADAPRLAYLLRFDLVREPSELAPLTIMVDPGGPIAWLLDRAAGRSSTSSSAAVAGAADRPGALGLVVEVAGEPPPALRPALEVPAGVVRRAGLREVPAGAARATRWMSQGTGGSAAASMACRRSVHMVSLGRRRGRGRVRGRRAGARRGGRR